MGFLLVVHLKSQLFLFWSKTRQPMHSGSVMFSLHQPIKFCNICHLLFMHTCRKFKVRCPHWDLFKWKMPLYSTALELIPLSEEHISSRCKVPYSVSEMKANVKIERLKIETILWVIKREKDHFTQHFSQCLSSSCHTFLTGRWAKGGVVIQGARESVFVTKADHSFFTEPVSCLVFNAVGSTNVSILVDVHCKFNNRIPV